MKPYERTVSIGPAGVMATVCMHKGTMRNTGSPSGDRSMNQLATRERQAGPYGMAERLVVLTKPSNSGGGKEPQLKGNARSNEGPRDWR
jgi:hypothetical protein